MTPLKWCPGQALRAAFITVGGNREVEGFANIGNFCHSKGQPEVEGEGIEGLILEAFGEHGDVCMVRNTGAEGGRGSKEGASITAGWASQAGLVGCTIFRNMCIELKVELGIWTL